MNTSLSPPFFESSEQIYVCKKERIQYVAFPFWDTNYRLCEKRSIRVSITAEQYGWGIFIVALFQSGTSRCGTLSMWHLEILSRTLKK